MGWSPVLNKDGYDQLRHHAFSAMLSGVTQTLSEIKLSFLKLLARYSGPVKSYSDTQKPCTYQCLSHSVHEMIRTRGGVSSLHLLRFSCEHILYKLNLENSLYTQTYPLWS